jgi:hypothetical protein
LKAVLKEASVLADKEIPDNTFIMGLVTSLANAGSITEKAATMSESQLYTVFKHYSKTLKCMANLGYQHGDIKNDNLMVRAFSNYCC